MTLTDPRGGFFSEDIEFCMQMFNCLSVDLTVAKRKVVS